MKICARCFSVIKGDLLCLFVERIRGRSFYISKSAKGLVSGKKEYIPLRESKIFWNATELTHNTVACYRKVVEQLFPVYASRFWAVWRKFTINFHLLHNVYIRYSALTI